MSSARWTDALRSLASLAVIGVITAFQDLTRVANSLTVALTYLLVVLAVAAGWGLIPATCAAIAATLCLNYFSIPPIGTLTVADTQNWVALVVFLVVGIVASRLSERVRQQARQAEESRLETERLYALSRMILMRGGDPPQVAREAAAQIAQVFNVGGVQLYDYIGDQIFQAGPDEVAVSRDKLKEVAATRAASRIDEPGIAVVPLSLGGKAIGSIALVAAELSDAALQAIANLVSTALESARNQDLARRAEIIRQSEQFKSTLLDALAHQLKTPLTGIKAAVTGLLSEPGSTAQENRELLAVINEESERLRRLVDESIHMARIEAGKLRLDLQPCAVRLLIERALDRLRPELGPRVVQVEEVHDPPAVRADLELVGMVLGHLLDNAAKYSPEGSAITIRAERQGEQVRFSVEDAGPGIPEEEQDRIFERYYRSRHTRDAAPGLGMGLAIARDIVIAHGGKMWFESVPGQGSRFYFTLPAARGSQQP